jgi:hypothetical protein
MPTRCAVLFLVALTGLVATTTLSGQEVPFQRGDADASGVVDISDAVFVLNWLFMGGEDPSCLDAADTDDSGTLEITDAVFLLGWLFLGGSAPPAPGAETCGTDPTADSLDCSDYEPCAAAKIVFFHNGTGPMCLQFLNFLETVDCPVEEHLIGEAGFWNELNALIDEFGSSEGVSDSFGYFPIIFIRDRAFSGFNTQVEQAIRALLAE